MKVIHGDHPLGRSTPVGVELTRRNLTVLLAKLDYNRDRDLGILPLTKDTGTSAAAIHKDGLFVRAVEDAEHYEDRLPGAMLVNGELV